MLSVLLSLIFTLQASYLSHFIKKKMSNATAQQLNSNKVATNKFFYNWKEIKELKDLIRTGEPISRIAQREYARFNTTALALRMKMYQLAKSTNNIREWEGPKKVRRTKAQMAEAQATTNRGLTVPAGTTFEGTPKKVEIHTDHFRIYF